MPEDISTYRLDSAFDESVTDDAIGAIFDQLDWSALDGPISPVGQDESLADNGDMRADMMCGTRVSLDANQSSGEPTVEPYADVCGIAASSHVHNPEACTCVTVASPNGKMLSPASTASSRGPGTSPRPSTEENSQLTERISRSSPSQAYFKLGWEEFIDALKFRDPPPYDELELHNPLGVHLSMAARAKCVERYCGLNPSLGGLETLTKGLYERMVESHSRKSTREAAESKVSRDEWGAEVRAQVSMKRS